jgi:hypothetical protein
VRGYIILIMMTMMMMMMVVVIHLSRERGSYIEI